MLVKSVRWPRHYRRLAPWARAGPSAEAHWAPSEPPPSRRCAMGESAVTERFGAARQVAASRHLRP
eukprot:8622604-Alexandrium_andersonii.AAC.1